MDFFDKAETWDRATIEATQAVRLRATVEQAMKSPFTPNVSPKPEQRPTQCAIWPT